MQVSACQSQVFEAAQRVTYGSMRARRVFVYMFDVPPQVNDIRLGFEDAGVAPMPPRFRNIPDETVKALAFCLMITTSSAVTTDASWLVPSSANALTTSMWQSGEICEVLSTEAFTSFCQACDGIWALNSQGTIAICLRTFQRYALFFSFMCSCLPTW